MIKKQLYIIIGVLVAVSIAIILIIRFVFKVPLVANNPATNQPENQNTEPPTTNTIPESRTDGLEVWTGTITLAEPPTLTVGEKIYTLKILERNTLSIFEGKGYKTGDLVNVMGKMDGENINVSGLNKLVK
ncbi:MAG TPA: hypothetical protein PKY08_03550 [Candidatus Magasanikbacteria bacterium]|nr:hypothetical protein [Candidatus Magasanikbacteria bacterium]